MDKIAEVMQLNQKFDEDIRAALRRAFKMDAEKYAEDEGYQSVALLAMEVGVSLANMVATIRRPDGGKTFRTLFDFVVTLNTNLFWAKHSAALMPLVHTMMVDHLDSVSLQMERGEVKASPYDKLIMGAEMTPLAIFSMLLYLLGGSELQLESSATLKKELMPLLMK